MSDSKTWSIDILTSGASITSYTLTTSETNNKVEIFKGNFRIVATIKNTGSQACLTAGLIDYLGKPVTGSWTAPVPLASDATMNYDRTFHFNNGSAAGDLPVGSPLGNRKYTFQVRVSSACYTASPICLELGHAECNPFAVIPTWTMVNGTEFTIAQHGTIGSLPTFTPHAPTPAVAPGTLTRIADIVIKNDGNDTGVVNYLSYVNPGETTQALISGAGGGVTLAAGASSASIPLNATSPATGPWKLGLKVYGQSEPTPEWGALGTYMWEQSAGDNDLIVGAIILAGLAGGAFLLNKYVLSKH